MTKSQIKKKLKSQQRKAWAALSLRLRTETPYCQKCGSASHLQVHHLLPRKLFPQLLLDERNLVVLCPKCHTFCRESAHKDGLAFAIWLLEKLPEKFAFCQSVVNAMSNSQTSDELA